MPATKRVTITLAAAALAAAALASPAAAEVQTSHGLSTFGELKYPPDFAHFDYVNPDAPKGGRIVMRPRVKTGSFDSFNPYILKGQPAGGARHLFDSLLVRAFDEPDSLYGLVAASIEMPADRSFVVFNLRPEAAFSDGSPLTAEDVAFSIESLAKDGAPAYVLPLRNVEAVEVEGPHRLKIAFKPDAPTRDLPAIIGQLPIFSKAYFAEKDFADAALRPPLGSGPYRVKKYEPGRYVEYALRDAYWARDLPVRKGQFNFEALRFEYFRDNDTAFEAFRSGLFDLVEVSYSKNWATKYDFEEVQKGMVVKEKLPDGRPAGARGFWINARRPQLQDRRVRAAIGYAFDFEWSNRTLFYGLYMRSDSLFENTTMEATPQAAEPVRELLTPYENALPPTTFDPPVKPPVSDGTGRNRKNLLAAQALLEEAGWKLDGEWRKNAAGETLKVEFVDRIGPSVERIINPFLQNLRKIGIDASLRAVDAAQYQERVKAFDFDILSAKGFDVSPTPGPELMGVLMAESAEMAGSRNLAGIRNPAIDAMVMRMSKAQSRAELEAAAQALDRVFRAEHFWVPQWHRPFFPIAYWNKFGRPQDLGIEKPRFERAIVSTWWYDEAKSEALTAARKN
ncbi:MAG: extracellular solute-binding protein [Pseudomonadota bacterium]